MPRRLASVVASAVALLLATAAAGVHASGPAAPLIALGADSNTDGDRAALRPTGALARPLGEPRAAKTRALPPPGALNDGWTTLPWLPVARAARAPGRAARARAAHHLDPRTSRGPPAPPSSR